MILSVSLAVVSETCRKDCGISITGFGCGQQKHVAKTVVLVLQALAVVSETRGKDCGISITGFGCGQRKKQGGN